MDKRAVFPNIAGGIIEIHFGYGSIYDEGIHHIKHHSCICDDCWKKKKHLTRAVREKSYITWEEMSTNYQDDPDWR